ncbi:MAG: hypothetical protein NVV66_08715 [Cellulomonas sp.]|uniref:hypothetical protein n=1 Tax=Cellulomonas sp. TaxID=40001 RepID=UPI00258FEBA9|nr:hypothetical protein [Cellulomonas sp.]MCR6704761.1 hypothetical protein [Cellulomonas sp.]
MSDEVVVALISAVLPVTVTIAIVVIVWWLREPLGKALTGVRHVKVAGLELELAAKALVEDRADRLKDPRLADDLVERAADLRDRLVDFRILWVDDHPENNQVERRFLRRAGATVINALSTHEALGELLRDDIDVIVTDFERGGDSSAGRDLAASAREAGCLQQILAYVGYADPSRGAPPHISLVTDHPDELLSRVLDIARDRPW